MIEFEDVKMGKLLPAFNDGNYQDITFCVTEQCNFRCKYCYMYKKNGIHKMSFDTAKAAVDFILGQKPQFPAAAWNFIGGEATLEMELIDKITDYIRLRLYETNHEWFAKSEFNIETNGYLYDSEFVQRYRMKNGSAVHFAITIDGTKEKHDLSRVLVNGNGTYDVVEKNVQLWIKQIPGPKMTKSTFSSDDLPLLFSSIVNLWNLGIEYIAANVVFENVWKEGDRVIYEEQLMKLADYIIENKLWNKCSVRFFDPIVGHPKDREELKQNFCGTGKMITVGTDGRLFPCIRFLDFCMSDTTSGFPIGDIFRGFDANRIGLFQQLSIENVSDSECLECPIASGCMSCAGNCYDDSKGLTLFHRTKYHCDMQKTQVRVSQYFWKQYSIVTGKVSPFQYNRHIAYTSKNWGSSGGKPLIVCLSDSVPSICPSFKPLCKGEVMSLETLDEVIEYSESENAYLVFLADSMMSIPYQILYTAHTVFAPANTVFKKQSIIQTAIPVYSSASDVSEIKPWDCDSCLLSIPSDSIHLLDKNLSILSVQYNKIILCPEQYDMWNESTLLEYERIVKKYKYCLSSYVDDLLKNALVVDTKGKIFPCLGVLGDDNKHHICIGTCKEGVSDSITSILRHQKHGKHCGTFSCMYSRFKTTGDISDFIMNAGHS